MRAKASGSARIAVVGSATSDGNRLREALSAIGVPGSRVDLYGAEEGEALIGEYAGEARLIQPATAEEIADHELVFLCEQGEQASGIVRRDRSHPVIDLVGALPRRVEPRLVHMDVNPESAREHAGFLAVPHPLAVVLAELLHPLERDLGIAEVVAVIVRPAADFGKAGIEELREQTVGLLNFADVPVDIFGRQLAFNLIPQHRLPAEPSLHELGAAQQVAALLGWERNRMALTWLAAPLFYGHGMLLRMRFRNDTTIERVREVVAASDLAPDNGADAPVTPLEVTGRSTLSLSELREDGLDGYWLWAVAGEAGQRTAEQAVRLAAAVVDL